MVMYATLRRSGGLEALSRHLHEPPAEAAAAAHDLMPHVLAQFRHHFDQAGGGRAGVDAATALVAPLGGSKLAFEILTPEPIAGERSAQVLAALLATSDSADALIAEACKHSVVPAERLAAALPLLAMLVGGYLTARVETARDSGEDIVAEFERLFQPERPIN